MCFTAPEVEPTTQLDQKNTVTIGRVTIQTGTHTPQPSIDTSVNTVKDATNDMLYSTIENNDYSYQDAISDTPSLSSHTANLMPIITSTTEIPIYPVTNSFTPNHPLTDVTQPPLTQATVTQTSATAALHTPTQLPTTDPSYITNVYSTDSEIGRTEIPIRHSMTSSDPDMPTITESSTDRGGNRSNTIGPGIYRTSLSSSSGCVLSNEIEV